MEEVRKENFIYSNNKNALALDAVISYKTILVVAIFKNYIKDFSLLISLPLVKPKSS